MFTKTGSWSTGGSLLTTGLESKLCYITMVMLGTLACFNLHFKQNGFSVSLLSIMLAFNYKYTHTHSLNNVKEIFTLSYFLYKCLLGILLNFVNCFFFFFFCTYWALTLCPLLSYVNTFLKVEPFLYFWYKTHHVLFYHVFDMLYTTELFLIVYVQFLHWYHK